MKNECGTEARGGSSLQRMVRRHFMSAPFNSNSTGVPVPSSMKTTALSVLRLINCDASGSDASFCNSVNWYGFRTPLKRGTPAINPCRIFGSIPSKQASNRSWNGFGRVLVSSSAVARSAVAVCSCSSLSKRARSSVFRKSDCFFKWSARSLTASVAIPRTETKIANAVCSRESVSNESHHVIYDFR